MSVVTNPEVQFHFYSFPNLIPISNLSVTIPTRSQRLSTGDFNKYPIPMFLPSQYTDLGIDLDAVSHYLPNLKQELLFSNEPTLRNWAKNTTLQIPGFYI